MALPECVHKLTSRPQAARMFGHEVEQRLTCIGHTLLQGKKNRVGSVLIVHLTFPTLDD